MEAVSKFADGSDRAAIRAGQFSGALTPTLSLWERESIWSRFVVPSSFRGGTG